jgi:hypothetical protein
LCTIQCTSKWARKKNKPNPLLVFFSSGAQSNVSCKKIRKEKIGAGIKASGLQYIDLSMKNDICTIQ